MEYIVSDGRRWLLEAWRRKTSLLGGVLAVVSLSLSHYAGFLMHVPVQVIAVAGLPLAKGVTANFLFYLLFCAVFARVIISSFQMVVLPWLVVSDRLERGFRRTMDLGHKRRFVRSHSATIRWEGYIWLCLQAATLVFLMLAIYVKFTISWLLGSALGVSLILVIVSGLVRSGFFLQPDFRSFTRKIRTRPARAGGVATAAFVTASAALIVVAFFLGNMRMTLLLEQEPQMTVAANFSGMANILGSSEGAVLLFQKNGEAVRYIYSSQEFSMAVESEKSSFPPIGTKEALPKN